MTEVTQMTGNAHVDEAVQLVTGLADRPAAEHVAVFEKAHALLREALADAGEASPVETGGAGEAARDGVTPA